MKIKLTVLSEMLMVADGDFSFRTTHAQQLIRGKKVTYNLIESGADVPDPNVIACEIVIEDTLEEPATTVRDLLAADPDISIIDEETIV